VPWSNIDDLADGTALARTQADPARGKKKK
jgi:hypothetical protein